MSGIGVRTAVALLLAALPAAAQSRKKEAAPPWTLPYLGGRGQVAGREIFVDGHRMTLEKAVKTAKGGDTILLGDGLHRVQGTSGKEFFLGPPGLGPDRMTVFKAAPKARPIITGPDGGPPWVRVKGDYIRLEGLWIGGRWESENGESPKGGQVILGGGGRLDSVREVVGCTFFGLDSVCSSALEFLFFQDNRLVRVGNAVRDDGGSMLYVSADHGPGWQSQHAIIDRNLFVVGRGYAVIGWHSWHNLLMTRNVVANAWGGVIVDGPGAAGIGKHPGSDNLIANNLFWKCSRHPGAALIARNTHCVGNVFANAYVNKSEKGEDRWDGLKLQVTDNAFLAAERTFHTPGGREIRLRKGQEALEIGAPEQVVDGLVEALNKAFAQPVEALHKDKTVEPLFARLRAVAPPPGSPLKDAMPAWFDPRRASNVGPAVEYPFKLPNDFWARFHARGLSSWSRTGDPLPAAKEMR
ncbi:MAG TPA: hypothetical protein VEJ18_08765 [Planctomycetota bacterium]|nr:hypothetical protein [Planctomycetota bacterium]